MNEAISKILKHLQREKDEAFLTLLERLDGYTWIDGFVFEPLDREMCQRVRKWIHETRGPKDVQTLVYSYKGRVHLEFEYNVFDATPVERLSRFEDIIQYCRRMARRFPELRSDWCSCIYGARHAYYRSHNGHLQLSDPVTRPDESTLRQLD
ncbi:hypothetical protein LLG95_13425 [bacterium]|nr:hypothetical protein [bacterium]